MAINLEARQQSAELRRAHTRARILQAAVSAVAQKGPKDVTIEDVIEAAGISRGSFYNYFKSTKEVILAIREARTEQISQDFAVLTRGVTDPAEMLAFFGAVAMHDVLSDPTYAWETRQMNTTVEPNQAGPVAQFGEILEWGIKTSRFNPVDPSAAVALAMSGLRHILREISLGRAEVEMGAEVLALALCSLGIDLLEARRLVASAIARVTAHFKSRSKSVTQL